MVVLISHDPMDKVYSAFGATEEEASKEADKLMEKLANIGCFVRKENFGNQLKEELWGWNLIVKEIRYS